MAHGQYTTSPIGVPPEQKEAYTAVIGEGGAAVRMNWGDGSSSDFDAAALHNALVNEEQGTALEPVPLRSWTLAIQRVKYADIIASDDGVHDWLQIVCRDGLSIVTGVPCEHAMVAQVPFPGGGCCPHPSTPNHCFPKYAKYSLHTP